MTEKSTKFRFTIESDEYEFSVIGIEPADEGRPYRILARKTSDTELEEIHVFYSVSGKIEDLQYIRK